MRIGVFGGTFDPPHVAHLAAARAAKEQLELDEVLLIPAGRNPVKPAIASSPGRARLKMVELAIADEAGLSCSDIEITRGGPSYSVETLAELHMAQPADYWLLLGSDQLRQFFEWHMPHRILQLCRLAAVIRPPDTRLEIEHRLADWMQDRVDFVEMAPMDISATRLRSMIKEGVPVDRWVKPSVLAFIAENRLYKDNKAR